MSKNVLRVYEVKWCIVHYLLIYKYQMHRFTHFSVLLLCSYKYEVFLASQFSKSKVSKAIPVTGREGP
jgi:hypothetical protein